MKCVYLQQVENNLIDSSLRIKLYWKLIYLFSIIFILKDFDEAVPFQKRELYLLRCLCNQIKLFPSLYYYFYFVFLFKADVWEVISLILQGFERKVKEIQRHTPLSVAVTLFDNFSLSTEEFSVLCVLTPPLLWTPLNKNTKWQY